MLHANGPKEAQHKNQSEANSQYFCVRDEARRCWRKGQIAKRIKTFDRSGSNFPINKRLASIGPAQAAHMLPLGTHDLMGKYFPIRHSKDNVSEI